MHFTFDYKTLHFKPAIWKRMIDEKLRAALVEGGTIWMNAAVSRIPVWSGASHGTFLKLAAKLGYAISVASTNAGMLGLGPGAGSSQSTGKMTVYAGAYILEYSTSLWHLCYNELKNANANPVEGRLYAKLRYPGPYHFQVTAAEEFRQYAKTVRLPDPKLATIIQTHKVK
jgi:hypothetical protein